jgi:hypothetical protein
VMRFLGEHSTLERGHPSSWESLVASSEGKGEAGNGQAKHGKARRAETFGPDRSAMAFSVFWVDLRREERYAGQGAQG